jgi:hypothetical protein
MLCNQEANARNLHIAGGNPKKIITGGETKHAYFVGIKTYLLHHKSSIIHHHVS